MRVFFSPKGYQTSELELPGQTEIGAEAETSDLQFYTFSRPAMLLTKKRVAFSALPELVLFYSQKSV